MQDIFTGSLLILAEIGLVLLVVFCFIAWRVIRRKSASTAHVRDFMSSYNEHKKEKTGHTIAIFETGCNIKHADAEKLVTTINASERKLYKRLLNVVLGNEACNIFDIQSDMGGIEESWMAAVKSGKAGNVDAGDSKKDYTHLSSQNEFLKSENSRLSNNYLHVRTRLQSAMEMLESLVKEYSMMYSDGESSQMVEAIEEELNDMKRSMREADESATAAAPESS